MSRWRSLIEEESGRLFLVREDSMWEIVANENNQEMLLRNAASGETAVVATTPVEAEGA